MKPKEQPEIHLRWLVLEKELEYNSSWISSGQTMKYYEKSQPKLQYSSNGLEWFDVITVIERVKE